MDGPLENRSKPSFTILTGYLDILINYIKCIVIDERNGKLITKKNKINKTNKTIKRISLAIQ
jgi:hypothetical protein